MRGAPGRTHSGRRPSPEVPRPDGINHSSSAIDNRSASRRPSRGPDTSAITCEKSPCGTFFGLRQRSKRAYTYRADVQSIVDVYLRAHIQIQYLRAARAIRSKTCSVCTNTIWLSPGRFSLSSFGRHVGLNLFICAKVQFIF